MLYGKILASSFNLVALRYVSNVIMMETLLGLLFHYNTPLEKCPTTIFPFFYVLLLLLFFLFTFLPVQVTYKVL